jgi:hypothetical protein
MWQMRNRARLGVDVSRVKRCIVALLCLYVTPLWADDVPPVLPYRPSVANPAQLPAPGWPELEAGGLRAHGPDNARSTTTPITFKLAFDENWGILVGGEGYVSQSDGLGDTTSGQGDLSLTLKHRFPVDDVQAFGVEFISKLPTARTPIGSGKTDWTVNGIYSRDLGEFHADVNVNATRLGAVDEGTQRLQGGWAISVSHPLTEVTGVTGELSGVAQGGTTPANQALFALNWNAARRLVFDVEGIWGLSRSAPTLQFGAGVTIGFDRWF